MSNSIKRKCLYDYLFEIPNFLSVFISAFFYLLPNVILVEISEAIKATPEDLSLIFTFFTTGGIIGLLTSVLYNIKFKKLHIILSSYILLVPITIIISLSYQLINFYILYFLAGYLTGVIFVQAYENIFESKIENKDRLIAITLTFAAAGGITGPLMATYLIYYGLSWRIIFYVVIFLILIIIFLYLFIPRKKKDYILIKKRTKLNFRKIYTSKSYNLLFLLIVITIIIFCIAETIITTWAPTFFRIERMFDLRSAGLIYTVFMIAVLLGRIGVSYFAGRIKTNYFVLILLMISLIFMSIMIFSTSKIIIFIATAVSGLGISGIYPLLFSSGGTIYKKGRGVLVSILTFADYLGLSIAPYLTRFISKDNIVLSISLAIILIGVTIILLLVNIMYRRRLSKTI